MHNLPAKLKDIESRCCVVNDRKEWSLKYMYLQCIGIMVMDVNFYSDGQYSSDSYTLIISSDDQRLSLCSSAIWNDLSKRFFGEK